MTQTWHNLLFAHWPLDAQQLRSKVPSVFELDSYDNQAWIGLVSFQMSNVRPRGVPALPWISAFPEVNVRTYVRFADRPGVYFFSLDAGSTVAVHAARTLLNLPYHVATMTVTPRESGVEYHSRRAHASMGEFIATYGPSGSPFVADQDSLDYFLTERYCLYHLEHHGAPYRIEIHHPPWYLQRAYALMTRNTMAEVNGITLPDRGPLLHFVKRQDMVAWPPIPLTS
jgi:uncharacterized protein